MLCIGIESSCDETALALVREGRLVDAVIASQADLHALFGGVVPELASREHFRFIGRLLDQLLERNHTDIAGVDLVCATRGPGLLGSLLVGVTFAKALALGLGRPFLGVNHLHAHLLAAGLEHELVFPALGLLVSGGHTHIYRMQSPSEFIPLGRTLDDAAGEAFDKVGKILGLPYPAGKSFDQLARMGNGDAFSLPRPYLDNDNLDFSFSGLKTAAAQLAADLRITLPAGKRTANSGITADFCASFNRAVVETIETKVRRAFVKNKDTKTLVAAGGVAANTLLRERLGDLMKQTGGQLIMPSPHFCTDNGAMIAYAGWLLGKEGFYHELSLRSIPRGEMIPDDMHCSYPISAMPS